MSKGYPWMTPGAKVAVVALFTLSVLLAAACLLFTVHYVAADNRKFCEVISGLTATPVQRPADAQANPSRETAYVWYERFIRLDRSLGC